jgi:Putative lumazine-binding
MHLHTPLLQRIETVGLASCVVELGAMKTFRISRLISWTAICALMLSAGTSIHAATPEEQAVLATVQAMFDGMAKRDAAAIKEPTLPGGVMVLMRDGKPTQITFEDFATRVGKPGKTKIEERIHDPLVRIDNDLAMVWAPFEFLSDGKVDHCGTDLFNLVRKDGKWLIASVADTGRADCAAK